MRSINSSYMPAIDHVRALAATLVILEHSFAFIAGRLVSGENSLLRVWPAENALQAVVIEGHTGVSLFMVLSGFIFTRIAYGRDIRYGAFLLNRVLRIYPLVIALFLMAYLVKYPDVPMSAFVAVVALPFQMPQPVNLWFVPHIHPYTSLFWTIAPEFQFYLLFPLILALVHARGAIVLVAIVACAIILRILFVLAGAPAQELTYFTLFGRIDQFMVGMGIALLYRAISNRRLEILCPIATIAIVFLLYGYNLAGGVGNPSLWQVLWPTAEAVVWGGFVLGYLYLAERLPGVVSRALASIGEVSFSMYLLHVAVISAALKLGPITFGYGPFGAAFLNGLLIVLPGAIALSWVSYRVIERPFLSLRVRYLGDTVTVHASDKAMAT